MKIAARNNKHKMRKLKSSALQKQNPAKNLWDIFQWISASSVDKNIGCSMKSNGNKYSRYFNLGCSVNFQWK